MKNKKSKTGFTLIEVIVAIAILLIAIMGPITVASRSIALAKESKNKIIAFYLAQEGIEYIRKIRDDNAFAGVGNWLNGLDPCTGLGSICGIDVFDDDVKPCAAYNNCKIKYEDTTSQYGHVNGNDTIFTRQISIEDNFSGFKQEAKIEVTVFWGSKSLILVEHIFNWK